MRKTIDCNNFGDENEIPVGLNYILNMDQSLENEPEAKKLKRQPMADQTVNGNAFHFLISK